jgi:hypothetical protein
MYVFDNCSLRVVCENYYPTRFPSLWAKFNSMVSDGKVVSVREVYKEVERWSPGRRLVQWAKENKEVFLPSTPEELTFVRQIFAVKHFQSLIQQRHILEGNPVADPFVIAKAKALNAAVVTQEAFAHGASKIPNICRHFGVECMDLEGFMERERWEF